VQTVDIDAMKSNFMKTPGQGVSYSGGQVCPAVAPAQSLLLF